MFEHRWNNTIVDEKRLTYRGHQIIVRLVNLHPGFVRLKPARFWAYFSVDGRMLSKLPNTRKVDDILPKVPGGYQYGPSYIERLHDCLNDETMFVGWTYEKAYDGDRNVIFISDVLRDAKRAVDAYEEMYGESTPGKTASVNDDDEFDEDYEYERKMRGCPLVKECIFVKSGADDDMKDKYCNRCWDDFMAKVAEEKRMKEEKRNGKQRKSEENSLCSAKNAKKEA